MKMINTENSESLDDFRLLLDLLVLSNTLADKLSKAQGYRSLFKGPLKNKANTFAKALEEPLKKAFNNEKFWNADSQDMFESIEKSLEKFLEMSIEGRLENTLNRKELQDIANKHPEKKAS